MAMAIGMRTAVAAVLDIHIDKNAVRPTMAANNVSALLPAPAVMDTAT